MNTLVWNTMANVSVVLLSMVFKQMRPIATISVSQPDEARSDYSWVLVLDLGELVSL